MVHQYVLCYRSGHYIFLILILLYETRLCGVLWGGGDFALLVKLIIFVELWKRRSPLLCCTSASDVVLMVP
jgi:hypothetical protein